MPSFFITFYLITHVIYTLYLVLAVAKMLYIPAPEHAGASQAATVNDIPRRSSRYVGLAKGAELLGYRDAWRYSRELSLRP